MKNKKFKSNVLNKCEIIKCKQIYDKTLKTGNYRGLKTKINDSINELQKEKYTLKEIYEIVEIELKTEISKNHILENAFDKIVLATQLSIILKVIDKILDMKYTSYDLPIIVIITSIIILSLLNERYKLYKENNENFLKYYLQQIKAKQKNQKIIKIIKK